MDVTIISACYDSGHYRRGMGRGPEAILASGLLDMLREAGHDVETRDIGLVGDPQGREIATGFAVCGAVAEAVAKARAQGRFPVTLAGNCLTTAGAVAGEKADAIVWFDQHGDLNTPETSAYGFLDGMALAVTLGLCWRPMAQAIPGFSPIDPARCVLVDARDLDADEAKLLEDLPVIHVGCEAAGEAAAELAGAGAAAVHVHLDLDIHDPAELRVNRYATPGGPSRDDVQDALHAVASRLPVCGLTVSAYDPAYDADHRVPATVTRLLLDLLATRESAP